MRWAFGTSSLANLAGCERDLRLVGARAMSYQVMDFSCSEGGRDEAKQTWYYASGRTRSGPIITYKEWPDGNHNDEPSRAVHFRPYPLDWEDLARFRILSGLIRGAAAELSVPIKWGGDWDRDGQVKDNNFNDLAHYELV